MRISEVIKKLTDYQIQYGDVELLCENGDGRSTWMSSFNPVVTYGKQWPMKEKGYVIHHNGY